MDLRALIREAVRGNADPDLDDLEDAVERVMAALDLVDDPRLFGGEMAGYGGAYDVGEVVIDTRNAVILAACEVALVGGVRAGAVVDPDEQIVALVLMGRVNKTDDRARTLYLLNEDGAAGLVTELVGLASRAGWANEFLDRVRERMKDTPT